MLSKEPILNSDFELIFAADSLNEACYSLMIFIYSGYDVDKFTAMVERSSI